MTWDDMASELMAELNRREPGWMLVKEGLENVPGEALVFRSPDGAWVEVTRDEIDRVNDPAGYVISKVGVAQAGQ